MARYSTIEKLWNAHGLECAVVRVELMSDRFHRCGYVRVEESHPWFGLDYNAEAPGAPADVEDRSMEDAGMAGMIAALAGTAEEYAERIEGHVAVHGGLTFASPTPSDDLRVGWWFGFDCAHLHDTPDRWTLEAVAAETERMAEQVAAAEQKAAA